MTGDDHPHPDACGLRFRCTFGQTERQLCCSKPTLQSCEPWSPIETWSDHCCHPRVVWDSAVAGRIAAIRAICSILR